MHLQAALFPPTRFNKSRQNQNNNNDSKKLGRFSRLQPKIEGWLGFERFMQREEIIIVGLCSVVESDNDGKRSLGTKVLGNKELKNKQIFEMSSKILVTLKSA